MKADWRECPRGDVRGQWAALYVTMNRKGHISMSRLTYQRLGEPKAFLLLFDTVNNRIGLKPTGISIRNAYPVGPQGRHGGKVVRAYRLNAGIRYRSTGNPPVQGCRNRSGRHSHPRPSNRTRFVASEDKAERVDQAARFAATSPLTADTAVSKNYCRGRS